MTASRMMPDVIDRLEATEEGHHISSSSPEDGLSVTLNRGVSRPMGLMYLHGISLADVDSEDVHDDEGTMPGQQPEHLSVSTDEQTDALAWLAPIVRALQELRTLGDNWDSYGGRPIRTENIRDAFDFLWEAKDAHPSVPNPSIYPTSPGGIGLSWDSGEIEVEVAFDRGGDSEIVVSDRGRTTSAPLDQALPLLLRVADRL